MSSAESHINESVQYSRQALGRAETAVRCSPFSMPLFIAMRWQGVELSAIAEGNGTRNRYTQSIISELSAEQHLLWLIQVGVLRREVDGQGLTNSFRLTPLGRQLLELWQQIGMIPAPTVGDHFYNTWHRYMRLPGWLQSSIQ